MSRGSNNPAIAGQGVQSDLIAHSEHTPSPPSNSNACPGSARAVRARPGEVDIPQRNATAVEKALALDARQMADRLVELACLLELVGLRF